MEETGGVEVAYVLWSAKGHSIFMSSFNFIGQLHDPQQVLTQLADNAGQALPVDWTEVQAVSYNLFEPRANGYGRYNYWFDQSEMLGLRENTAAATLVISSGEGEPASNEEIIEVVEEILREERAQSGEGS